MKCAEIRTWRQVHLTSCLPFMPGGPNYEEKRIYFVLLLFLRSPHAHDNGWFVKLCDRGPGCIWVRNLWLIFSPGRYTALLPMPVLSVCLYVCLSVRLSHSWATTKRFKQSKHMLHIWQRQGEVSSVLRPNFVLVSFGQYNEWVKDRYLRRKKVWPITCDNLGTVRDRMQVSMHIHIGYIFANFCRGMFHNDRDRGVSVDAGLSRRTTPRCLHSAHWHSYNHVRLSWL